MINIEYQLANPEFASMINIDYQDMIDRNEANNEVVQQEEITQIESYEKTIEHIPAKPNTDDFVLFDEPYSIRKKIPCEVSMKNIDNKLPPYSVLGNPQAIRNYWCNKAKRQGEARRVKA